jgi:hypothetical protein
MKKTAIKAAMLLAGAISLPVFASSHMDAPLIVLDPSANTTDVYAFVQTENGVKSLVTALGVYPFEEPGIGPNKYNFDDNVLYEIHVSTGQDLAAGMPTFSYQFQFKTTYKDKNTILQSYLGVITNVNDAAQNLTQTYSVTKVDHHHPGKTKVLGMGVVPPNNQGIATPFYNQNDDGENPARPGVADATDLDRYTAESIQSLANNYVSFAGQRDDGFYGDIQAVFDLLQFRNPGKDAQAGFNIHLMALSIPISELGGSNQIVGVYATTSRRQIQVLGNGHQNGVISGPYVQVARQGNPLFNEALVAIADKDLYSRTTPSQDKKLFAKYALNPELCTLINDVLFNGNGPAPETNRTDIAGIFIPDMIKVDLSTADCRLAGGGPTDSVDPDDPGYSNMSIFGGDTLTSSVQVGFGSGTVPGGWPNGRRFGDDVVDIAVTALISDLRVNPPVINGPFSENVPTNDVPYNKVFPYESTPHNGRTSVHF